MRLLGLWVFALGCATGGNLGDDDVADDDAADDDAADDDAADDDVADDDASDDDSDPEPVWLRGRVVDVPGLVPSGDVHVGAFLFVDGEPPRGALRAEATYGPLAAGDWALPLEPPPDADLSPSDDGARGALYVLFAWREDGTPGYGPDDLAVGLSADLLTWVTWSGDRPPSIPATVDPGWNLLRSQGPGADPLPDPIPDGTDAATGPTLGPWLLPRDTGAVTLTFPEPPGPAAVAALHASLFDPPVVPDPVRFTVAATGTQATLVIPGPPPASHVQQVDGLRAAWYGLGLWHDDGGDLLFVPGTCDTLLAAAEDRYLGYLDGHGLDPLVALQGLAAGLRPGWLIGGDDTLLPLEAGITLAPSGDGLPPECED